MVGQPYDHRWRAPLVASPRRGGRLAQCRVLPQPVVLEDRQPKQCVPCPCTLGEGVRLARQACQPVSQNPVYPLNMHGHGRLDRISDGGTSLDSQQPSMLIAVLDRLR